MKTTIDAMKQAVEALSYYQVGMNDFDCHKAVENDKSAIIALNKAIKREEAQTVEPLVRHTPPPSGELGTFEERAALRAWQVSSGEQDATEGLRTWAGITEREALISAMNMYAAAYPDSKHFRRVAVMLAADAQAMLAHGERAQFLADTLRELADVKAQQVAVPQGWKLVTTQAANDVLAERHRQISVEGWTPEHDDTHSFGEMARAGAAYAAQSLAADDAELECDSPPWWPHGWTWKPSSRRRMLIKSAALILAEIERIDRAIETHHHIGVK